MYEFSNQIFGGGGGYSPSLSYDPSSAFNVEPSMDYSFEPDYSSFNPNSFMDYSFEPDYSFEQDYSFDPFMDDSYGGIDPVALAGLGLGGGFVSSQVGGTPATSQVLSPFAQRVAAQDASRMAARNLPQLIGTPQTYQGVPTGPNTPAQYTGTAQGRPVPGTQLAPQGQPPAVRGTGGAPAVRGTSGAPMKIAQKVGTAAKASRFASPGSIAYTAADLGTAALTGKGITQRIVEPIAGSLAELYYGDGNLPAFSPEELAQIQQGPVAQDPGLPQMSRLGDEPLTFTAPTGLSSAPQRAAELAATLPDDSGLMGAPGVQGTGIPTTTLDIDGGSVTVPQALADQTFQGIGAAPMSIEETRARLGGRTLNEYLNAPSGTEGVSGLRTDPQGRMIPAGFETRADAYGDYERESAAREGRLAARMQQPGESITERDTRNAAARTVSDRDRRGTGEMSMADAVDMFGSEEAGRAAILRQRQGIDPFTGKPEQTPEEKAQEELQGQLQSEILQARLDSFKQTEPDKLSKAQAYAKRLGLQGDAATAFIFSQMGTSMDDIFGADGTGLGGESGENRTFATEEEAIASGVKGEVTIGGRPARI